jgi:uncharacterized membrane protein YfcA
LLALVAAAFAVFWLRHLRRPVAGGEPGTEVGTPGVSSVLIGVLTDFFDTLGIGSFAPTTALFRFLHLVPDRLIPGTLNVGHALPSVAQALVFIAIVEVAPRTLAAMIAASVAGAWLGAGVVAGWPRRRVQVGMGCALLVAAALMLRQLLFGAPGGADAVALDGTRLVLGVAGNLVLGALMTIGVGLYGPCMILVSLLGMNATAAFPIMMGSCAFLMPVAGLRFIRTSAYAPRAALGLTLGGIPAVLVAAFVVRALPLGAVRVLVLVVALYTALAMLRAAAVDGRAARDVRRVAPDLERETT